MNEMSLLFSSSMMPAADIGKALRGGGEVDRETLRKRAVEFEAVYLAQILQPMFDELKSSGPFGGGFGEDIGGRSRFRNTARRSPRAAE